MIVFDLICANGHVFEAWFASSADHADQQARGLVACPACDSRSVGKAVMAPAVPRKANAAPVPCPREALVRLHARVRETCAHVGPRFAEEARRLHALGPEAAGRGGIWGEASAADVADLIAEDIPVLPLPPLPPADA